MAKSRKSLGEKIAEAADQLLHPSHSGEVVQNGSDFAEENEESSGDSSVNQMSEHPKFSKFKKG